MMYSIPLPILAVVGLAILTINARAASLQNQLNNNDLVRVEESLDLQEDPNDPLITSSKGKLRPTFVNDAQANLWTDEIPHPADHQVLLRVKRCGGGGGGDDGNANRARASRRARRTRSRRARNARKSARKAAKAARKVTTTTVTTRKVISNGQMVDKTTTTNGGSTIVETPQPSVVQSTAPVVMSQPAAVSTTSAQIHVSSSA